MSNLFFTKKLNGINTLRLGACKPLIPLDKIVKKSLKADDFELDASRLGQGTMLIDHRIDIAFHTIDTKPTALNTLTTLMDGRYVIPSLRIHQLISLLSTTDNRYYHTPVTMSISFLHKLAIDILFDMV